MKATCWLLLILSTTACYGATIDEVIQRHFGDDTTILYAHTTSPEAERHRVTENLTSAEAALHAVLKAEKDRPEVVENVWIVSRNQHRVSKALLESWDQVEKSLQATDVLCRFSVRSPTGTAFGIALIRNQRVERMIEFNSARTPESTEQQ